MAMLGLHLALVDEELRVLGELSGRELADHISNDLEPAKFGTPDACETDRSWAYIHAALTGSDPDGPLRIPEPHREKPAGLFSRIFGKQSEASFVEADAEQYAIAGKMPLLVEDDYYIGLVPEETVGAVAEALRAIPDETLAQRLRITHLRHGAAGDAEDAASYAIGWYPGLVSFYERAAASQKHVIFTVDF